MHILDSSLKLAGGKKTKESVAASLIINSQVLYTTRKFASTPSRLFHKMAASQLESLRKYGLESAELSLPCIYPECDLQFKFTKPLYAHIRTHGRNPQCPYCSSEFPSMGMLVHHVRVHTKHKPYICPFPKCTYATPQKGCLKLHLQNTHDVHQFSLYILST